MLDIPVQAVWTEEIHPVREQVAQPKKLYLVVNAGSKWGLTKRDFGQLVQLEDQYASKGLQILMFPSNSFNQEPLDSNGIEQTYRDVLGAKWWISEKISVNGKNTHPMYVFLR